MMLQTRITQIALNRGLSRSSVICALLTVGAARADNVKPGRREELYRKLETIQPDLRKSEAFTLLCRCKDATGFDEDIKDYHSKQCRYVLWRDLIDDPLESLLD